MKTGPIILGLITLGFAYLASIFGIDTVLATGSHSTISEWVHNWMQDPTNFKHLAEAFLGFIGGLGYLFYHFWSFKSESK
jgi:hypothetical protein